MQAIQESNDCIKKALDARDDHPNLSEQDDMYLQSEMARTKAYQAIAYALLAVADALKDKEGE